MESNEQESDGASAERTLRSDEESYERNMPSSEESSEQSQAETVRRSTRVRAPNVRLDEQAVLEETIQRLNNTRRGVLSAVTAKRNEISALLLDDKNIKLVITESQNLQRLFDKYFDAHHAYRSALPDLERFEQVQKQYNEQDALFRLFMDSVREWISNAECREDRSLEITPNDSASQVASKVSSIKYSSSSSVSNRSSVTSQLRANEAARMAELTVQAKSLEIQQRLEQEKLRIQQQENRLKLEMEIAKSAAKEKALADLQTSKSDITGSPKSRNSIRNSKPTGLKLPQIPIDTKAKRSVNIQHGMKAEERYQPEQPAFANPCPSTLEVMLQLQSQQNSLNIQQNEILKGFSLQQQKASLPSPRVPLFDGNPLEYHNFIRAFENIIETKVISNSERLYYLEQFTTGQARELVKSCHHMTAERSYQEARALLKRNYGNEYRIAAAYMEKVLKWPDIKPEDNQNLHRFSILLVCCKNVMDGNEFMTKFDNPENINKIVQKLPFGLRSSWRRYVDEITEVKRRLVTFTDLADFVEKEARIATHPVFGNILTVKSGEQPRSTKPRIKGSSFGINTEKTRNACEYCVRNSRGKVTHTLQNCETLKSKPYGDRIDFLKEMRLCFGCLHEGHLARHCTTRLGCKVPQCFKKHPSVLHTVSNPRVTNKVDKSTSTHQIPPFPIGESPTTSMDGAKEIRMGLTSGESETAVSAQLGAGTPVVARAIVPVKIRSKESNKIVTTYAFLDNGSDSSFCSEMLAKQLGIEGVKTTLSLTTMEKKNSVIDSSIVQNLEICDLDENVFIDLPSAYTTSEIPVSCQDIPTQEDVDQWPHLQGIHLPVIDAQIGILIASDVPRALEPLEIKNSENGGPYATRTLLGWAINGPLLRVSKVRCTSNFYVNAEVKLNQVVMDAINRDFSESISDVKTEMSREETQFMTSVEKTVTLKNGHYVIALPFKNQDHRMPNNKEQVEQRARWLKLKLLKNPKLLEDYKKFINNLLKKSYAQKVPPERLGRKDGKVWYIPHHGVYHPHKPDKVRVVFDCSCRYKGMSLNDHLLKGPDLTNQLVGVLLRFREEHNAFMADIESMFYQVRIPDSDADSLRFLWWTEGDLSKEPEEYQMLVHLFGAVSSPSCSNFALLKTAEDNKGKVKEDVIYTVKKNFYVDDCLKSTPTTNNAITLAQDLRDLLTKGGFHLTQWTSNSRELLVNIPEVERAKSFKDLDLDQDKLPIERALGIQWSAESDEFGFKIVIKDRPPTRRGILSMVSSIYDPLGFLSPVILTAKSILQELCRIKIDWDDKIPDKYLSAWLRWLEDLPKVTQLTIPRCYKPAGFQVRLSELHHFADASESGYGSVSYLRQESNDERIHCSFVISKSRVTPLKSITIPRLELSAATVSVRVDSLLQRELDIPLGKSTFWTDSTAVLRYVENEDRRFQTFVANRVAVIRDQSDPVQWKFVDGALNPADFASRGLTADKLLKSNTWIRGPDFLWKSKSCWPERPPTLRNDIPVDDPEVKRDTFSLMTEVDNCQTKEDVLLNIIAKFSSWHQAIKIVAWILRYRRRLLSSVKNRKEKSSKIETLDRASEARLDVNEMKIAEKIILQCVQQKYFQEEVETLQRKGAKTTHVKKSSPLRKLDPIWKDGLLLVGGRLRHAPIPENAKHPILLPKEIHVTNLIIQHYHYVSGHLGREYILSLLRRKYWILQANSAVRKLLSRCVSCRRWKSSALEQKMADLPKDRLTPDHPPFTFAGIDYFGPFLVRRGRSLVKRYGVVFTCLVVRAVHIEIAHSLDTDSFILALRRFIARRGQVKEIRTDNGTNFTSGEKELRESIVNWNQEKIHSYLLQKHIKWSFNPPYGSHHGGVWERMIRSIRGILRALLKEQVLDDEGLQTVMCEIEALLNGRPITKVSNDPNDPQALTPNNLLLCQPNQVLPPGIFNKNDVYSKRRWRQVQYMSDLFWKRWIREYLPILQQRQKWLQPKRNLHVDDIVLLVDSSSPRNMWQMGRIMEVTLDKTGLVRRVLVKTRSNTVERPVDKLVLLLEADDPNSNKTKV